LSDIQYFSLTVHGKAKRYQIKLFDPEGRVFNLHGSEPQNGQKILSEKKMDFFRDLKYNFGHLQANCVA